MALVNDCVLPSMLAQVFFVTDNVFVRCQKNIKVPSLNLISIDFFPLRRCPLVTDCSRRWTPFGELAAPIGQRRKRNDHKERSKVLLEFHQVRKERYGLNSFPLHRKAK
jgi:hypothetical protein